MMTTPDTKPNYSVPNLERSFIIMEKLGESKGGLTLTELVNKTEFPQNSIFRICRTLGELGYLHRDKDTKRYQLTQRILSLALGAVSPGDNLIEVALPHLKKIAAETGETCCLGTIVGNKGVVLAVEDGTHAFRFHIDLGISFNLYTAAPGKAMLAVMECNEHLLTQIDYSKRTENTITDIDSFRNHLLTVKEQGYGVDHAEEMAEQHCIGAAIKVPLQPIPCGIWITAPSSRLPKEDFHKHGSFLRNICLEIEHQLEFQQ